MKEATKWWPLWITICDGCYGPYQMIMKMCCLWCSTKVTYSGHKKEIHIVRLPEIRVMWIWCMWVPLWGDKDTGFSLVRQGAPEATKVNLFKIHTRVHRLWTLVPMLGLWPDKSSLDASAKRKVSRHSARGGAQHRNARFLALLLLGRKGDWGWVQFLSFGDVQGWKPRVCAEMLRGRRSGG